MDGEVGFLGPAGVIGYYVENSGVMMSHMLKTKTERICSGAVPGFSKGVTGLSEGVGALARGATYGLGRPLAVAGAKPWFLARDRGSADKTTMRLRRGA